MRLLWTRTKQLVEPSSATALAAVLANRALFEGRRVGIILSGGQRRPRRAAGPVRTRHGSTAMKNRRHPRARSRHRNRPRLLRAFNRGDWASMQALLADDVAHDQPGPARNRQAAFAAFQERMARCYHEQLRDVVVMASPDGARAAAEYIVHGEYLVADDGLPPANEQKYVLPGGAFFGIRDGLIARVTNYYNLEGWLAQVR
jgi:steroid delta-isomerase-like uncharacterized protein